MTLKTRLLIYLAAVHAGMAVILLWQRALLGAWLLALELVLVASFLLGWRWIRMAFSQAETARTLAEVIEAGEYGARYPLAGRAEVDAIIAAYNRILSALQQERYRLGEQRGFVEKFLHDTPVGVLIHDFDDRISLVNPRMRTLLDASDDAALLGRALHDLDSPIAGTLATLTIDETRMITDAAGRRLRCHLAQFLDRGFPRSYVLIEELTTELNRSERETYEKLIRMMSHEVTNAVAATNSLLESCRSYVPELTNAESRADYANALDVLIARNRSLNEFITGFSNLVKLPPPQPEEVDVRELLKAMQTMFKAELDRRDIRLEVAVAADLPVVAMDRGQMDQVLINVIKNAAEAIDHGGSIRIAAARDGDRVVLSISDDGAGLTQEVRARLFTPFYTSKRHGQGLGLTLVKEILTQHGFAFSLDTRAGRTCFTIAMPGSAAHAAA